MILTGGTHIHSSFSYDAKLTLAEIRIIAIQNGLSFLCMTEHSDEMTPEQAEAFVAECRALSDESFVFIPGFEADYNRTHVLMIGCPVFVTQHASMLDLPKWKEHAALAILAHPHRGRYLADAALISILDGVEVWNAQYDGKRVPRNGARRMLSRLRESLPLKAFAGWDFHRASHAGGPVIRMDIGTLTEEAVLSALKTGSYTLESKSVSVASDGRILRGIVLIRLESALTTAFLAFAKGVNAFLALFGLRIPKKLAAPVRSRI